VNAIDAEDAADAPLSIEDEDAMVIIYVLHYSINGILK
jgi:hypothetical protein